MGYILITVSEYQTTLKLHGVKYFMKIVLQVGAGGDGSFMFHNVSEASPESQRLELMDSCRLAKKNIFTLMSSG